MVSAEPITPPKDKEEAYQYAVTALIKKARTDFFTYVMLFRPPGETEFVCSKLHRYLIDQVQVVADERAMILDRMKRRCTTFRAQKRMLDRGQASEFQARHARQATSVPPQHGKTTILSLEAGSWLLGRFPRINIAITSFSVDRAITISKDIRDRTQTLLYAQIFPDTRPLYGSNKQDAWTLTNGSTIKAKSVGQRLTGNRVDWLIIDDPHPGRKEAESPAARRDVVNWYYADCYSRLSPGAAIFIIATRWHPHDLIGHLTSDEKVEELTASGKMHELYNVVNIPALCDDEENAPLGRREGEAAFPEVRDVDFMETIKATQPAYEWDSQYQGHPKASASGNVDLKKIVRIPLDQVPENVELVDGWDLAVAESQASDYSVSAVLGYDWEQDIVYLVDIFRNRKRWGINRGIFLKLALDRQQDFGVQRVAIEAVAGFGSVYSDVKEQLLGEMNVKAFLPPRGGKLARATPWLNKIEAGRFRMVVAPWNKDFLAELEVFGGEEEADHDDQVDAVSTAWERITGKRRNGARLSAPLDPAKPARKGRPTFDRDKGREGRERIERRAKERRDEILGTHANVLVEEDSAADGFVADPRFQKFPVVQVNSMEEAAKIIEGAVKRPRGCTRRPWHR